MKTFALLAIVSASDKKVPPRHPLQRLSRLNEFAEEWCDDHLTAKQANNWKPKFMRNTARFQRRFELCGYYDEENMPHGGPKQDRKRRSGLECDIFDDDCVLRYDRFDAVRGIKQITTGYSKWAQRYIVDCKVQPVRQQERAVKWMGLLQALYQKNVLEGLVE